MTPPPNKQKVGKEMGGMCPYPVSFLPKPVGPVHADRRLPLLGLQVVILGLLQVALGLQLLREGGQLGRGPGNWGWVSWQDSKAHLA